jgi:hypothetical protein
LRILTARWDSKSFNTLLFEVLICSNNEGVFILELIDHTLQIIFDAWRASMNVGSKRPNAGNNSQYVPSWWFYLHCGIEETGSPGIICIICHQVLRHLSEHGTSSVGKDLLANDRIANWNELTESEGTELTSSRVNDPALAILNGQECRGITIVCSQSHIMFDVQCIPYWPKWQAKRSKLAAKYFETSKFRQDTWDLYLMLGFVLAYNLSNDNVNLELPQTDKALRDDLVLSSATTLSNIYRRQYALTVEAIKTQLPSQHPGNLSLDWWTLTNKLALTLVIAY